jgi:hypothetical protein
VQITAYVCMPSFHAELLLLLLLLQVWRPGQQGQQA